MVETRYHIHDTFRVIRLKSSFLPSVPLGFSGYSPICMTLDVASALTHFLNFPERLSLNDCRMMILLDVFLMLSVVWYSLLLREVRGKGLIENDITDILLICQCGFDGTFRPLSHFS